MQEEVNQKVISLSIQGVKITASVLKAALRKFLEMDNRRKQKATQVKMAEKTGRAQEKGREKARKKIEKKKPHGKQTIKQLNAQGVQLSNLKITDENIKSFDRVARKYGIDYSLKKEVGADPPKYLVFFKAKDVDVMTAAFREYAGALWLIDSYCLYYMLIVDRNIRKFVCYQTSALYLCQILEQTHQ